MTVESLSNGVVTIVVSGDEHIIEINDNAVNIVTGGTTDHSQLTKLSYAESGHTGFEPARGTNDNYVTDTEKTILSNTSGTNTGDQDLSGLAVNDEVFHKSVPGEISDLAPKEVLAEEDATIIEDSENSFSKAKTTLGAIRDFFKQTYDAAYNLLYAKLSGGNIFTGEQSMIDGLKVAKIYPNADGTTSILITKADKSTVVLTVDTTNGRIGVGKTPVVTLDVSGSIFASASIVVTGASGMSTNKLNTYAINTDLLITTATVGRVINTDRSLNQTNGLYFYQAASPTTDTVNDVRFYNNAGTLTFQKCTVANATKGGGTWINIGTM